MTNKEGGYLNLGSHSMPLPDSKRLLIITHDVDWPRQGPGTSHILARQTRFSSDILRKVTEEGYNPYYGIPTIMEIEARFNLRSTFFFRPQYDDGSPIQQYADTITTLVKKGWEVGLHSNQTATIEAILSEKMALETIVGGPVYGSRVHYLNVSANTFLNLANAGIKYDSSLTYDKEKIDPRNTGYRVERGLVVFPITFMDTYLFTYLGLTENTITDFIINTMERLYTSGVRLITLLWHDNSIMMKGGRAYSALIENLASRLDISFLKGIEAFELVHKQIIR